jgi:hypothetical protein
MDRLTPDMMEKDLPDRADGAHPAPAGRAARAERRLAMLAELAAIGMRLAREVERQALGEVLAGDPGLAFSRISRAVRQTLALEARLDAEAEVEVQRVSEARKRQEAARLREARKQKERVRRHVEDAIAANDDGRDAEGLRLELDERLEDPDYEDELGGRPIGVIVAGICSLLGVNVDLRHFTDAELDYHFIRPDFRSELDTGVRAGCPVDPDDSAGEASEDPAIANDTGDPPSVRAPVNWLARPKPNPHPSPHPTPHRGPHPGPPRTRGRISSG